jgi:hypothetical protein
MTETQTQQQTQPQTPVRPLILTVICVVLFLGTLMAMQVVFNDEFKGHPPTVRYLYLASVVLTFFAAIGIFAMRRWGVILYAVASIGGQAAVLMFGWWNPISMILALLIIAVCSVYFRSMR